MEKQMHGFRARLDYWLKHNYAFYKLFNVTASACMKVWGWFVPMDDKMIIFSAHSSSPFIRGRALLMI